MPKWWPMWCINVNRDLLKWNIHFPKTFINMWPVSFLSVLQTFPFMNSFCDECEGNSAKLFYWSTTSGYPLNIDKLLDIIWCLCDEHLLLFLKPIINLLSANISVNCHIVSARLDGSSWKHQNSIEWGGSISTWLSMNIQWCWYDQSTLNIIYLEAYCD